MERSTVHFFVCDTMVDSEYGYAIAGINNPMFQATPGKFKIKTVGVSDKPVTSAGGLRVEPDMTLAQLKSGDSAMLILPGGALWEKKGNGEAAQAAAGFLANHIPVAAICGATAGLARIGLLDEIAHTSNSKDYLMQTGYQGAASYRDEPSVVSGKLITAAAMSPVEFARDIFEMLGIYSDKVLAAWYGLYKTGDAKYFAELMKAAG
ncbi:DJ-1/PfpI family protein [Ramlibacter sp.]|uniref:DJ-1/PfpI family protein n=1 Tax=Ramlibacter sp. TaxID=1917967 RepID=UPI0017F20282|nr:DJ-1/PfpI family protein [Ramlibacter sp.]MBA2676102.1 DJ-1/PfpI family protein [Ramlibacter sp.]